MFSGGYELLARDVVQGLQERGHRVAVVTTGDGSVTGDVARVLRLSRSFDEPQTGRDRARHAALAIRTRLGLRRAFRRLGLPDAVLVMSLRRLGTEALRVYREHGVPAVLTINDDWPVAFSQDRASLLRRVLDGGPWARHTFRGTQVARAVYLTDSIRSEVRTRGARLPDGRIQAQGVPLKLFPQRVFRAVGRVPELLYVGRLHPSKAPEVPLDAVAELRRRGLDARLTVAGSPHTAAYGEELRVRARTLGIEDRIRWLGHVAREELAAVYAKADVFLFPCAWEGEGQGLTYLEAMAVGVPVVAYPRGGARQVLADRGAHVQAEACTGKGFAEAVAMLVRDAGAQRALVESARRLVRDHVSLDRYVDTLAEELAASHLDAHPT